MYALRSLSVLLAATGFVASQSLGDLPQCSLDCINKGLPTDCNGDPKCICSSKSFINSITCCVAQACEKADQDATLEFAQSICMPAGVSTLPTSATCAPGAASTNGTAASTTGSGSMSMSSMTAPSTSALSTSLSSAMSSASEAASSLVSSASNAAASATETRNIGAHHAQSVLGGVGAALLGWAALL